MIKIGGSTLNECLLELVSNLDKKKRYIIIHGWSYYVNDYLKKHNIQPEFYISPSGFKSRKTSKEMIKIISDISKEIRDRLVSDLKVAGLNVIGADGKELIKGNQKFPRIFENKVLKEIKDDYTGKISEIDDESIFNILKNYDALIMTPLIMGEGGVVLSTDADITASLVASKMNIKKIFNITSVGGYLKEDNVIPVIRYNELKGLIKKTNNGMKKKLLSAKMAIESGVEEVILCDSHIFQTNKCTVISR